VAVDFFYAMDKREGWVLDLGMVSYEYAFDLQKRLVCARSKNEIKDTFILLEHFPVFTANREESFKNIIVPGEFLEKEGIKICKTDRGGDVTYHGPGQIVGYNIMDLNVHGKDLHAYIRSIEQILINTLENFGIRSGRDRKHPGVWVENEKIAAIGIAVKSGWITMHGFALNVNPNIKHYEMIIPCGIFDKGVTSMRSLLGSDLDFQEVKEKLVENYGNVFGLGLKKIGIEELQWLMAS
jgi:lipoyl(octanoyl) transferase